MLLNGGAKMYSEMNADLSHSSNEFVLMAFVHLHPLESQQNYHVGLFVVFSFEMSVLHHLTRFVFRIAIFSLQGYRTSFQTFLSTLFGTTIVLI